MASCSEVLHFRNRLAYGTWRWADDDTGAGVLAVSTTVIRNGGSAANSRTTVTAGQTEEAAGGVQSA